METRKSFEWIYNRYFNEVLKYVNTRTKDYMTAEEITQDVFIKIHKHLDNYDPSLCKLNTWIYTITNRVIIDYFRKGKSDLKVNVSDYVNDNGVETYQFEATEKTEALIENSELANKIFSSFEKLKGNAKIIAKLRLFDNLSYDEICEKMNLPMGTVKAILFRAKETLQKSLRSEHVYN